MPDGSPATAVYEWAGSRLIAREIDHLDGPAPLNRMRPGPPPGRSAVLHQLDLPTALARRVSPGHRPGAQRSRNPWPTIRK
jgi:hypothetical protein